MIRSTLLLLLVITSSSSAQHVGDTVVVTARNDANLMSSDTVVTKITRGAQHRVKDVNGTWLSVERAGHPPDEPPRSRTGGPGIQTSGSHHSADARREVPDATC